MDFRGMLGGSYQCCSPKTAVERQLRRKGGAWRLEATIWMSA